MRLSSSGITLSELLISVMIVGIMIVGITSMNFAIHRMDRDSSRNSALSLQSEALAERYRQAAFRAIGDKKDPTGIGIKYVNVNNLANYICFRHDDPVNSTPSDYTNDIWQCFTRLNTAGTDRGVNVYTCNRTAAQGPGPCMVVNQFVGKLVWSDFPNAAPIEEPYFDTAANPRIFHMQLISRLDPTAGADIVGGALTNGTDDNPQVVATIDVSPEAHGF